MIPPGRLRNGLGTPEPTPSVVGLHHLRVPVSEVMVSRDWYVETLGFESLLDSEDEDRVTGIALEHPSGLLLGVHLAPGPARALRGFTIFSLMVTNLGAWLDHLEHSGIDHSDLVDGHLGAYLTLPDPDGILVELHNPARLSAQDA